MENYDNFRIGTRCKKRQISTWSRSTTEIWYILKDDGTVNILQNETTSEGLFNPDNKIKKLVTDYESVFKQEIGKILNFKAIL